MKRLLLNSSNIKPVNIRIISNGVECADLKMLKENFCISDIKNVLDGRLANWLGNIGEKELADSINEKYSSPDSLNGKEYYLCELFFRNFTQKDYIQILFKEKSSNLFTKEISRLPNLLFEAYNSYPDRFTIEQWNIFLNVSLGTSEELKRLKANIEQKQKQIDDEIKCKNLKEDIEGRDKFRSFLFQLLWYYANTARHSSREAWKIGANNIIKKCKLDGIYRDYAIKLIDSVKNYDLGEWGFRDFIKNFLVDNNLTAIKL